MNLSHYAALMSARLHFLNTGGHDLTDYLMVSALFLLVLGLSMPTIMQLIALLRADVAVSPKPQPENRPESSFARVTPSPRLTSVRIQARPADGVVA